MDVKNLVNKTKSFCVLYIEDDKDVQEDTKAIFANLFNIIDTADDGVEGLQKYNDFYQQRRCFYDLVISDITMPNMDGIQMSQKILQINKQQAILVLSAYNDSDKLVQLIELGISNFIHKPIEMQTLFKTLQKICHDILEYQSFKKNIDKIKDLNDEYNTIIKNYDNFVIATRTDLEGNFVDISTAYENISGYKKEELIGQNATILRHKEMSDTFYKDMWQTIQAGEIWSGEIKNRRKNGESYWISSIISPYIDKSERVIGYNAISEDITRKKKIEALNVEIQQQQQALQQSNEKLYELLNNTEQGFLSCNINMQIEPDYSLQCTKILEEVDLKEKNIATLLFNNDITKKETFKFGFNLIVNEEDCYKQEEFFSLMPKEHFLNEKYIKIEYKMLSNSRIMLILTDTTNQKKLKNKLVKERELHRMIIAVISDSNQFWETKAEFHTFLSHLHTLIQNTTSLEKKVPNILRKLHTFKGLFSQKELIHTPQAIHALEESILTLLQKEPINVKILKNILEENSLANSLSLDISMITNILGTSFLQQSTYRKVNLDFIEHIENRLDLMINQKEIHPNEMLILLEEIRQLKKNSLLDLLTSHAKQTEKVALLFSKKIYPISIICDKNIRIDKTILPFIKSLVHIFRNAVIHGIETPEIRKDIQKDVMGKIDCIVKEKKRFLSIKICDDGIGLNSTLIKQKALELGFEQSYIEKLPQEKVFQLILKDHFSTYMEVNEYAGRGVGLSAMYEDLMKIQGQFKIKSKPHKGLTWIFLIPKTKG